MTGTAPTLQAPRYGLLLGETQCHICQAPTPTVAVWVAAFQQTDDDLGIYEGEAALLRYIQHINSEALKMLHARAPWLRMAATRTAGMTYLAHHCTACEGLQGDHYVFSPDGPYWPQDDGALARLRFEPGLGPLTAQASAGESAWMERVEHDCYRD